MSERDLFRWQAAIFVSQMPEVQTSSGRPDRELQELIVAKLKEVGLVSGSTKVLDENVTQLVHMARLLAKGV